MSVNLILTAIGDDRPGLVESLATAISTHEGNWLESSMSQLAGKFAGILRVSVPEAQSEALIQALKALPSLRVTAEVAESREEKMPGVASNYRWLAMTVSVLFVRCRRCWPATR